MASFRQIQVMKDRIREKLSDIFSQQKTIIATINAMSSEVKIKADSVLKSQTNEVTVPVFVNVLEDLERCFNNLLAIAATMDDALNVDDPTLNPLAQDSLSEYQVKWSDHEIPEFDPPGLNTSLNTFSPIFESNGRQHIPCDFQNYSTNQYRSRGNNSVNFCPSRTVELCEQIAAVTVIDPQVGTVGQTEYVPQQQLTDPNSNSDAKSMSNDASSLTDMASLSNIASIKPFIPKSLSIESPYGLGPELEYPKITSLTNVQVCETITPYCFWVQISRSEHLLEELASEIHMFISSSKYNTSVDYGIACPCVGMMCVAPFTDGSFYRARVLSDGGTKDGEEDTLVYVLYVDYGNMDFIQSSSLMKMPKSLSKLPIQAICCALSKVMPYDIGGDWSTLSSEIFHSMVYYKDLACNPVYGGDFIPQIVDLYLVESTSPRTLEDLEIMKESKVNSILIDQGFALPIMESCQIEKIYQIVKDWILFKSSFSLDDSHNLVVKKNSPELSTPFIGLAQTSENLVVKESNSLNFLAPVATQTVGTSYQGAQLDAFSGSCSKTSKLNDDATEKNLLHISSKLSQQVTALGENCIPDSENNLVTSNSQAVVTKSDNYPVTAAVETVVNSSTNDCGKDLFGSTENLNSADLSSVSLSPKGIQTSSSGESCLSSDLESVDSKPDLNGLHSVMITHVVSPSSFYVHHIIKDASLQLKKLVQDLNADFYCLTPSQKKLHCSEFIIENGKLCCAYLADEESYYRGLIIEHKTDLSKGVLAKVFYIDFGNTDWLHCDNIYSLPQQYSTIPALARHCALAYVRPKESVWTDEAKAAFGKMIKIEETYFIKIVADSSTLDKPSLANYNKAPVKVLMTFFDGSAENGSENDQNEKTEICLNYDLIDLNHADLDSDNVKKTDLVEWDPMSEDFDSRRNNYDTNIDDAQIATVGFIVNDEMKICKFFRDGRKCWRGEKCPFKHIRLEKDCLTVDKQEAMCDVGQLGQIELPRIGSSVGVEVSAVSSPLQFYVIFPWGTESVKDLNNIPVYSCNEETLPDLQESLQCDYNKVTPRSDVNLLWTIGELVVAQAPADEQWYRAQIAEVSDTPNLVKVFFVDFGNVQWISEKYIQPIKPQFVHLPHQAVECCLDGIASASDDGTWSQEARDYFLELVDDVVLVAHINCIISKRVYINLYNTSKEEDLNIAEELVRMGIARKLSSKPKPSIKSPVNETNRPESKKNVLFTPG